MNDKEIISGAFATFSIGWPPWMYDDICPI